MLKAALKTSPGSAGHGLKFEVVWHDAVGGRNLGTSSVVTKAQITAQA